MTREQKTISVALDEAAAWAARFASDMVSEADWRGFEAWLATPGNREAYDRVEAAMASVDDHAAELRISLEPTGRVSPVRALADVKRNRPRTVWLAWGGGLAAAAAVAFFAIPSLTGVVSPSTQIEAIAYAAPGEGTRTVKLADGSEVTLNRGAMIRVQLGAAERKVELASGEAAFKVAHDPARPFRLTAGKETIVDLGTEFNVLSANDKLVVTVRAGRVRVELAAGQPVELPAGEQMRLDRVAQRAIVSKVNPDDSFAWQGGRLVFHNASLSEVVERLNDYAVKPIKLADATSAGLRFSGVLVIGSSANMVGQLEAFFPVRSEEGKEAISLRTK